MIKRIIFAATLLLATLPASATVLWHGGELPDFTCVGTCSVTTTAGQFRASLARLGVRTSASSAADPQPNRLATPSFTGAATIWLHYEHISTALTTTSNVQQLRFIDNIGNPVIVVRGTGTNNQMRFDSRTTVPAFTTLLTCTLSTDNLSSLAQYDIKVTLGVAGEITLYQNSVQQCTFSGDTRNGDGATTITAIDTFGSITNSSVPSYSEIIVADADTRGMSRFTMYPTGSGNATSWSNSSGSTPCTTTILAQTAVNDANYVNTGSNAQKEQCTVFNTWPAGVWSVSSVSLSIRSLVGATGPQHITPGVRISGTDYDLTPDWAPTTSFAGGLYLKQDTSPASSSAWTQTELSTAGFNVGFKSAP